MIKLFLFNNQILNVKIIYCQISCKLNIFFLFFQINNQKIVYIFINHFIYYSTKNCVFFLNLLLIKYLFFKL